MKQGKPGVQVHAPEMSHNASPAHRLRLHDPSTSAANATRNSIISSSAKGWSPLQINKRDSTTSPLKPSPNLSSPEKSPNGLTASPRRTSNSFKHVARNSLVSNSPFKSPTTTQGQQAAGLALDPTARDGVIHERRYAAPRPLGQTPDKAAGIAATPKSAIGLGITATRPRSTSRTPSGSRSAVSGTRKVSGEKAKVAFPTASMERRVSGDRKVSGSKENDSPDVRAGRRVPRASVGLKGLAKNEYVSKSPFLSQSKRIPSGDQPPSRTYDSPSGPSPKTIPIHRDDIFSSPSPRRTSNSRRRSSPSPSSLRPGAQTSDSPTPSPPRTFVNPSTLNLAPASRPSPLGLPTLGHAIQDEMTPTPTPHKSSMTPSRRLRGPRDLSGNESPTRKTVTFQSVPDVKEFERMSVEGSADGSFDVDKEEDHEWLEDEHREDSLEEILSSSSIGGSQELLDKLGVLRVANPDTSPILSDMGHVNNDESTTADFVNTLIEEGLFSPPQLPTPAFEDQPTFELPLEDDTEPKISFLSTPSLGDSVHATPLLAEMPQLDAPFYPKTDSDGVPYGRSHHAERAVIAHSFPPMGEMPSLEQPRLPHEADHGMLLNANAAQPALPVRPTTPTDNGPRAHQSGAMHDPFITIQTATDIISPPRERSEDGIPLGRTSHAERVHAARVLATQSIGLGMPRSAAVAKGLTHAQTSDSSKESVRTLSGREVNVDEREVMFDVSFEDLPLEDEPKSRGLPKPPKPEPLDVPSPVTSPAKVVQQDDKAEKRSSKLNFSLPFIGLTSPFSISAPTIDNPRIPSSGSSEDDQERPLTPPPITTHNQSKDSPHRLPELEFGDLILSDKKPSPTYYDPFASNGDGEEKAMAVAVKPLEVSSPVKADFAPKSVTAEGSTTTRVRQRISREAIRETIQKRIADGSISKRSSFMAAPSTIQQKIIAPDHSSAADKDLPPPPPTKDTLGFPMTKASTTDASPSRQSSSDRPAMRPRSHTQSAHDVLKAGEKDGLIDEPRSALDKLVADISPNPPVIAVEPQSKLVGILQKPKQAQMLVPPPVARTPSDSGMKGSADSVVSKRQDKAGEGRSVSGISSGSRKSRRSLSTGDMGEEADAVKTFRHSAVNSRLTLGGIQDDGVSMLEAFREDIGHIGSERGYKVRERPTVKARYGDKIGHSRTGGDIDNGKAWRSLRRPSDMNEHAAEIRAMRARDASNGKTSATVFVKVLGVEGLAIPIPEHQTMFCITLDNGIDYIRTPYTVLAEGARVNQEFSLVEHPNFEFSLSLDIRRDPHILKALHEKSNAPIATLAVSSPAKASGFRGLFGSPRKPKAGRPDSRAGTPQPPAAVQIDNIARYLATPTSSTIAKTHVAFKPIAKNCEAKVLEIRYPMFAMFKGEPDRSSVAPEASGSRKQVAKITLQIFRLPPLPGLKPEDLPGSIDECLRGIRHHAWHEHEYHEGILTQQGADCALPRRRMFKLIGGNLVAINEVTKKQVASIDLRRMTAVVDLNQGNNGGAGGSPKSTRTAMTYRPRDSDEAWAVRPRSFRVEFGEDDDEGIMFVADRNEDKTVW
ncbi:hypothetical protein BCR39DRAFT_309113 [Naematelia encephala]|uniref:PH domain-containing protein n=1 Tax=Naematelia encephala TaxID=71784 RepID=A0A1Y2AS13_9TREE|nr:hypothetical protein BCR39DRAFT_309113 [Naematelia encephala]